MRVTDQGRGVRIDFSEGKIRIKIEKQGREMRTECTSCFIIGDFYFDYLVQVGLVCIKDKVIKM